MTARPEVVREVRAKYGPIMTDEQCGLLTYEVAYRLAQSDPNWGVSAKPQGKASTLPNGQRIAHDILHYRTTNTLIDILQAAGAESSPQWAEVPYHGDPAGRPWVPATDASVFGGSVTTPPSLPPPVAGPTLQDVLTAIALLQDRLTALAHDQNVAAHELLALRNDYRRGMVLTISAKPFGTSTGTVKSPA